jgi:DNA-directed RNA polymerase
MNKLNLPIIWRLPHGLKVSKSYLIQKRKQIKPFTYLKNSISLTTTIKNSIDKNKQILAFMPNLVHSLDSSTLILLYYTFYNTIIEESQFVNF